MQHLENNSCSIENGSTLMENFKASYPIELWKQLGLFKEDFLNDINIHWLAFSPPGKNNHYVLATMYALIMIVGVSGNVLVITLFMR